MDNLSAVECIFFAALEKRSPEERAAYLQAACGPDTELRRSVERLLNAQPKVGSFLQAAAPAPTTASCHLVEVPGTRIGPYKLLQQIGEGGMGAVYMAEQEEPVRRTVALKIIKPGMDSAQVIARFEAERQALALMDHTNIAKVFDAGTTDTGRPYFVMEMVHGVPITKFSDENQLTPRERLELFVPVCQAIQHAHQKGIIHRDIKPSNVLVTLYDDRPVPKVIDFGVAKAIDKRLTEKTLFTQFGVLVGTFEYMSPEQAEMNALGVDTRSDIYSLGVLLYELLTGTTPLERERLRAAALEEVLRVIKEEEPPRPSVRLSSSNTLPKIAAARKTEPAKISKLVRGEIDWIVMKCLEKDRSRRYETANGLARDVEHYLHDEPVEACPPSARYRLRKFARKYRMPVTVAAAFAAMLVAGVVVSAWQALRATDAEQRARTAEVAAKGEAEQARRQAYVANIGLMRQAWESRNMLQLQDLLDETASFPERGFEWYYWQRQCHVEHLVLVGHTRGLLAVAFASDGQRLVTGGTDGTARIWDATSGRELLCLRGHLSHVTAVAYAPDGQWLVTGSLDGTARIWDAAGGGELRTLQNSPISPIRAVAVTPDGRRLVTGSEDGTAQVWNAASGQKLLTLQGHTAVPVLGASVVGLVNSPLAHGPVLAASALYPGRTGHTGPIWTVAVTQDGKRLITGSYDNMIMLWDAASGRQLRSFQGNFSDSDPGISGVAVTPDGKRLLTAGHDNAARVWDADTGRATLRIQRNTGWVLSVAVTPDGQRLVTGHSSGAAKVWDVASGREILTLMGHGAFVTCVAVSPDGQQLATASLDGTARVWDMASGRRTRTLSGHTGPVSSIAVTPDGQRIVTGSWDRTARVWDTSSGRQLLKLEGHTRGVASVAVTPDGQRIITGGWDGTARVWDAARGQELLQTEPRKISVNIDLIRSVALTPDGQRLVTASWQVAQLWEVASGRKLRTFNGPTAIITSVAVTPDGQRVVMGCWNDRTARLWDIASGQELLKVQEPSQVTSVVVTPDNLRFITGRSDGRASVWDMASGRKLFSLKGHTDQVTSIAVTSDGQRIITGSVDGTARLWDAVSGRELLTLDAHAGPVRSVALTPDGRRLLTASEDGTVQIWEAASAEQTDLWTRQQQEFERRRAAWQRPMVSTPGFIQDWLVLAPVALEKGVTGAEGLEREQLAEAQLKPRAGDSPRVGGREYTWQAYHEKERILDFNRFVGKQSDHSVAYAVCYVISAAERNDLLLQVGSDDQAKVYLNGEQVYKYVLVRDLDTLDTIGPVRLRKGTNVLVFKVVNEVKLWEGCARFVDREGKPVPGLQVRLTPE